MLLKADFGCVLAIEIGLVRLVRVFLPPPLLVPADEDSKKANRVLCRELPLCSAKSLDTRRSISVRVSISWSLTTRPCHTPCIGLESAESVESENSRVLRKLIMSGSQMIIFDVPLTTSCSGALPVSSLGACNLISYRAKADRLHLKRPAFGNFAAAFSYNVSTCNDMLDERNGVSASRIHIQIVNVLHIRRH
nr:hypothetical protein CFP56_71316 [Quercus suber]